MPPITPRSTLRRLPQRGSVDRATVHAILDAGFLCHVAIADGPQPVVIPMVYARDGDQLVLHGSAASRLLRQLGDGAEACVAVTHLDGLVVARSGFHHSANYRSVVLFAKGIRIDDVVEKRRLLDVVVNGILPGRSEEIRQPTDQEVLATAVITLDLNEATAKLREGPPSDDKADLDSPVWAGVLPIETRIGAPVPSPDLRDDIALADSVRRRVTP